MLKSPDQKETAARTRRELRRKDPELYRWIAALAEPEDLTENHTAALVGRGDKLFLVQVLL